MKESATKILIIEDEMIIGANISLQLTKLGYEIIGIISRGEEALLFIKENEPDIILMDIRLKGKLDGIETAQQIQKEYDTPIIYITANADEAHFNRAKSTKPQAFISKPFKKLDLQRAIELTLSRIGDNEGRENVVKNNPDSRYILSDSIFVRHHEKMLKIIISNIFYVEAERNYCRIYSKDKNYLLVMTLKTLDEKLPKEHFMRIHRSFIINISQIDEVGSTYVVVAKRAIPISKIYREELLKRLQTV
ncbi:response regulator [Fulvivirgaceae bacterium BMA10]|uniref:Response regulator n=1 Tax=Splendidivirga corallicola TaxID=3051826 RepID=A0ABT8KVX6_9BACT|nr:response regulator [Fulvivirgaceae bacterium BMA10]